MDSSEQLFILISPKELKDELVNLFISKEQLSGFNLKKSMVTVNSTVVLTLWSKLKDIESYINLKF